MLKELDFLLIDGRYGGDQNRFSRYMMRLGGCSTVCACHAAACLAQRDPEKRALSPFTSLRVTETAFQAFAEDMFRYVYPGFRGMPKTSLFEKAFRNYASSRGVEVQFRELPGDAPYAEAEKFVRESIDGGYCVQYLLLLHQAEEFSEMEWHWFTLTGYEEGEDGFRVIYSTWGRRCTAAFQKLWDTGKDEKGGMIVVK
jgi:hypothetical protein